MEEQNLDNVSVRQKIRELRSRRNSAIDGDDYELASALTTQMRELASHILVVEYVGGPLDGTRFRGTVQRECIKSGGRYLIYERDAEMMRFNGYSKTMIDEK